MAAKDNKRNAAGAGTGAASAPATENATAETKRTRLAFGKDKQLAYLITGLVAILASEAVAKVLTEEQKAVIAKAKDKANEIGGDPLKPVNDRIAAIQAELKQVDWKQPNASAQVKELALELDRQEKRQKQIKEMIAGK